MTDTEKALYELKKAEKEIDHITMMLHPGSVQYDRMIDISLQLVAVEEILKKERETHD